MREIPAHNSQRGTKMEKFKITYTEGLHINKTQIIEAENAKQALLIFYQQHPNAVHEGCEEEEK